MSNQQERVATLREVVELLKAKQVEWEHLETVVSVIGDCLDEVEVRLGATLLSLRGPELACSCGGFIRDNGYHRPECALGGQ